MLEADRTTRNEWDEIDREMRAFIASICWVVAGAALLGALAALFWGMALGGPRRTFANGLSEWRASIDTGGDFLEPVLWSSGVATGLFFATLAAARPASALDVARGLVIELVAKFFCLLAAAIAALHFWLALVADDRGVRVALVTCGAMILMATFAVLSRLSDHHFRRWLGQATSQLQSIDEVAAELVRERGERLATLRVPPRRRQVLAAFPFVGLVCAAAVAAAVAGQILHVGAPGLAVSLVLMVLVFPFVVLRLDLRAHRMTRIRYSAWSAASSVLAANAVMWLVAAGGSVVLISVFGLARGAVAAAALFVAPYLCPRRWLDRSLIDYRMHLMRSDYVAASRSATNYSQRIGQLAGADEVLTDAS